MSRVVSHSEPAKASVIQFIPEWADRPILSVYIQNGLISYPEASAGRVGLGGSTIAYSATHRILAPPHAPPSPYRDQASLARSFHTDRIELDRLLA